MRVSVGSRDGGLDHGAPDPGPYPNTTDPRVGKSAAADTKILTKETALGARAPSGRRNTRACATLRSGATFFYNDGASETITLRHEAANRSCSISRPASTTMVNLTLADMLDRYKRMSVQLGRPGSIRRNVKQT